MAQGHPFSQGLPDIALLCFPYSDIAQVPHILLFPNTLLNDIKL